MENKFNLKYRISLTFIQRSVAVVRSVGFVFSLAARFTAAVVKGLFDRDGSRGGRREFLTGFGGLFGHGEGGLFRHVSKVSC